MSLDMPAGEVDFTGLAFSPASVFAGGGGLVVERIDSDGLLEVGVALTGALAAEGVSGSGPVGCYCSGRASNCSV